MDSINRETHLIEHLESNVEFIGNFSLNKKDRHLHKTVSETIRVIDSEEKEKQCIEHKVEQWDLVNSKAMKVLPEGVSARKLKCALGLNF